MESVDHATDFADAYGAIAEDNDAHRWAFGSGFDDPLAGVDTSVPSSVDGVELAAYCLMLGDDALVLSHRLQEWVSWAPELEDDVAIANIALDLLGQARLLLARAGKADGSDRDEDGYAYLRSADEFRNVALVELDNRDFAFSIARLLAFSTYRLALLDRLRSSRDPVLAAIAAKGVKEVAYHRDYAARWMLRLGDGTDESHRRTACGLEDLWPYVDEPFTPHEVELRLAAAGVAVDPSTIRKEFDAVVAQVLSAATLAPPPSSASASGVPLGGRDGRHTGALPALLAEMQALARAHPETTW